MSGTIVQKIPVENDMKQRSYEESEKLSSKVFKVYPLIGDFRPNQKTLDNWFNITRQYIERRLENKSARFHGWVYEQVTLVVVHCAKNWNSFEEGKFSKYVAMQLGYKDENGRIWSLLTDAIENAFKSNHRLFIVRNGERQFYETVMLHSFGPAGSWHPVIDLLFSFYSQNLDWTYIPGDPLFAKLVNVLQGYFNNAEVEDDSYNIASVKYYLRVGIRRLVQERPGYSAHLFERMVKRIQQLTGSEESDAKRYSDSLVDSWFANRISNSTIIRGRKQTASTGSPDLALDYSKVNVRYIVSDGKLSLRIPAIRIVGDETGEARADLYDGEKILNSYLLNVHGNELGETIQQKTIQLPNDKSEELRYRVVIKRGTSVIYDSENKLWRQMVFFSGGKEISSNRLHKEKYDVFIPDISQLNGTNYDVVSMPYGMHEIALHKDYMLEYAGSIVAIDTSSIKGVRIVEPATHDNVRFVMGGEDFYLYQKGASIKVYCADLEEARRYSVGINGENHSLADYFDSFSGNRSIIPLEGESVSVSIVDISAGSVIFRESYYYIPDFKCEFNKKIYVSDEDYEQFSVGISYNDHTAYPSVSGRDEVALEYGDGMIVANIPHINTTFNGITTLFFNKYLRTEDITEDAVIEISNKSGLPYSVSVGGEELGEKKTVALSKYASGREKMPDTTDINLTVAGRSYLLGRIVSGNAFIQQPLISFKDKSLLWDGGSSFIGEADADLSIKLMKDDETEYFFDLTLGKPLIHEFGEDEFADGQYDWMIKADSEVISRGNCFIGDESKARFEGKTIQIDFVTEDVENSSKPVPIKTTYIDQITYIGTKYVDTEEGVYDIYSGHMYWVDWNGERRYYSYNYNDKGTRYKVNPVKIIYISEKYLRIVNEDDEGIYYYYKDIPPNIGNEITDREPSAKARNYHDILFYMYEVRDVEKSSVKPRHNDVRDKQLPERKVVLPKKVPEIKKVPVARTSSMFEMLKTVSQRTVIDAPVDQRILVNAGPGTGKTWTLIERIIHLVQEGTDPESIQVLCFSRAAVEVVRNRMAEAVAEGRVDVSINLVDIRTFDSFASQLLYWVKESDYDEVRSNFRIETLDYEKRIALFTEVLRKQPALIEQCEHLIVDEVQDLVLRRAVMVLNMIKLLPEHTGVTLFGDACQAIYDYQVEVGMSSDDFYKEIAGTGQFTYYSFDHNYRQASQLQDYCEEYRKVILKGDIKDCNSELAVISSELPDYSTENIKDFEEDSLDRLKNLGKVGILTRSNAEAMVISGMFHRKNIPHSLQRRLSDNSLNGWIAAMFNQWPASSYDEEEFIAAFSELISDNTDQLDPAEIWQNIISFRNDFRGRLPVADILRVIRDSGKNAGLYIDLPDSDVIVSTIHRSKGREYDSVIILKDLIADETDQPEEHRVHYVALSRAKQRMYKADLPKVFFKTLDNRRCYSSRKNFGSGSFYLSAFEVGKSGDFRESSFCENDGVQEFLRDNLNSLKGKEVYLEKAGYSYNGFMTYSLILKENGMVLGKTSEQFGEEMETALRKIYNLPWHVSVYENNFPKRLNGIYIVDVASEIRMLRGNETGIREFGNLGTWNIVLAEGYAKAEFEHRREY